MLVLHGLVFKTDGSDILHSQAVMGIFNIFPACPDIQFSLFLELSLPITFQGRNHFAGFSTSLEPG
jgi:hypothetical protein